MYLHFLNQKGIPAICTFYLKELPIPYLQIRPVLTEPDRRGPVLRTAPTDRAGGARLAGPGLTGPAASPVRSSQSGVQSAQTAACRRAADQP